MTITDLIIIGSGPGGYRAAAYAAKNGIQVIVFEDIDTGGTCLNRGCIPTKCLAHDAYTDHPDFLQVMQRKSDVTLQLRQGVESLLTQPGIQLIHAKATLRDYHTVVAGGEEYQSKHIILATGSTSKLPPIEGLVYQKYGESNVMTSDELLNIDHVPSRLCIIGAGVIGMEFASIFASFGSKVTVVEFMKECLPTIDSDIAKRLRKCMEKRGTEFYLQAAVRKIESGKVIFEKKGKENIVEADEILIATGRAANIEGLNLDEVGVAHDKRGILVNDNMETSVKGIYAIGDVNAMQMLAHAAVFQGRRAINNILGISDQIRFDIMPAAVFTYPEAGCVGKTEDTCKEENLKYSIVKGYYRSNGRALSLNETEGMVKLIVDTNDKIIGCHIYGAEAADLVQEISSLMNLDITLSRFKDIIHTHPTLGEILQDAVMG